MPWLATLVIRHPDGTERVRDLPRSKSPRWAEGVRVGTDEGGDLVVTDASLASEHFRIYWRGHHQYLSPRAPVRLLVGDGIEPLPLPIGETSRVDGKWFEAGTCTFKIGSRKMAATDDPSDFNPDFELDTPATTAFGRDPERGRVLGILLCLLLVIVFAVIVRLLGHS